MNLSGTTVTSDPRKGLLLLRKSDDGLMHLIWQERSSGTVEDDLIVFPGDAALRHIPACKDGFAMVLEFTTGRKLFFWSQEMRAKGSEWAKPEDNVKESELMAKANGYLGNSSSAAPAPASSGGFGGMTHAELMAMLSGPSAVVPPRPTGRDAPAESTAAPEASPPPDPAPAASFTPNAISSILNNIPTPSQPTPAPATAPSAPSTGLSADAVSSILSSISPPPPAAAPASEGFTASSISNILGNIAAAQANPPVTINDVIHPEYTVNLDPL